MKLTVAVLILTFARQSRTGKAGDSSVGSSQSFETRDSSLSLNLAREREDSSFSSKARASLGLVFHFNRDFLPEFCCKKSQKNPEKPNLFVFSNFYHVTSYFVNFSDSINDSKESYIFCKKARTRKSLKIPDSTRY
jgi:hypothetical protein